MQQYLLAVTACEASRVKFPFRLRFKILPLDTLVATLAEGAIQRVVMTLAIRVIRKDIKVDRLERLATRLTNEAFGALAYLILRSLWLDNL